MLDSKDLSASLSSHATFTVRTFVSPATVSVVIPISEHYIIIKPSLKVRVDRIHLVERKMTELTTLTEAINRSLGEASRLAEQHEYG